MNPKSSRTDHDPTIPPPPRPRRRAGWFKGAIVLATLGVAAALIAAFPAGRFYAAESARWARVELYRRVAGLEPDRAEIEADWARRRARSIEQTRAALSKFYDETSEPMRALFRAAGMDPEHGLIRYGRGDEAFLISPQVFELDDQGRSYRFRPNTRSVWLRQVTLLGGPFGMFQVLDTPAIREAAVAAGAIVDEGSVQSTNSWGLRGPEPDPSAPVRGVVLGDSFMQAMFNGDDETPSVYLAQRLEKALGQPVSIANTGHIGYSPEQYYYSLVEYGDRIKPHFVVISVCPNDFGRGIPVLEGKGDWYDEAAHWLGQIAIWCRSRNALFLLVPVPTFDQVESIRRDEFYPGRVNNIAEGGVAQYLNPLDDFINEFLRVKRDAIRTGGNPLVNPLYNRAINDDHFSPRGADLWARLVTERLVLLFETTPGNAFSAAPEAPAGATSHSSAPEPLR